MKRLPPVRRLFADRPRLPSDAQVAGTAGRLLAAALALFARRGYHAASIRDIGPELGLPAAVLYDHFASKEELLAELVRVAHVAHQRLLARALIASPPGPVEQLKSLVRAHLGFTVAAIGAMGPRVAGAYRGDRGLDAVEIAELHAELAVRMLRAGANQI